MSKSLLQIRTKTRTYLDESAQADWLDSEINTAINVAYQDVVGKVMEVYEGYFETVNPLTYTIIGGQQQYQIDSSLLKVTRVEINVDAANPNSVPVRAIRANMDEAQLQVDNNAAAGSLSATAYFLHGPQETQYIGFIPVPQYDDPIGTSSISVWGIEAPADLAQDTDLVRIPYADRFYELITHYAAAQLLRKGQQEESYAARYIQEYKVGISEMQTYLKERQQDGVWMIEDASGQDNNFEVISAW
jgi:hypothetical protein